MDSTFIPITDEALAVFGVPVGWLMLTTPLVIGWINTVKTLVPQWVESRWYPALGFAISAAYSYMTLKPVWLAVGIGTVALFLTQWMAWGGAKKTATAVGARTP